MKKENRLFDFETISHKGQHHSILDKLLFLIYVNDTAQAVSSNLSKIRRVARFGTIFTI